ncbi:MAG TPA: hypothetical protein VFN19_04400, partial [Candidatus Nanopelagicales bacterium]|nr:hypothetical protein [Candidatus Nanopelagicales bacterium]
MATHRRTPSRGRLLSFAAMLAALAVGLSVADPAPPLPPPDRPLLGAGRAAADGNAAPVPVVAAPVRAQVQRLLSQRAAAVRSGDARAYRASADGSAAERFRFGRLAALPVRTWAYRVGSLQPGRGGTEVSAVLAY